MPKLGMALSNRIGSCPLSFLCKSPSQNCLRIEIQDTFFAVLCLPKRQSVNVKYKHHFLFSWELFPPREILEDPFISSSPVQSIVVLFLAHT